MGTIIEMKGIYKKFGDYVANHNIDLQIREGEIHALLGENGAGKTTLMNIVYGLYQPTSGEILFDDKPVKITSPQQAINLGIGMVHQHFMLIPALTVAENIILGMKSERYGLLELDQASRKIKELSRQYGFDIDPNVKIWQLSVGQQQRVEIVKALYRGARLLILDEPTAVLTPQEVADLFNILHQLTIEGITVIFISHKLSEVMAISNRISVLRAGKLIGTLNTSETNPQELARMMVGREISFAPEKGIPALGSVVLEVKDLDALNSWGRRVVKNVSLEVHAGEILGIAGVDGNGQEELAEVLVGLRPAHSGAIILKGERIDSLRPKQILDRKVSYIPADRQLRGLVMDMSIDENLILKNYDRRPFSKNIWLDYPEINKHAREQIREYDIRSKDESQIVRTLSGGNQQKVILAREVGCSPDLLIAMHPTRGLDIGAIEYIHGQLIGIRNKGCAVLLISTELEEILSLSDRIAVIYEGAIMGILPVLSAQLEVLGLMMAGKQQS